MPIVPMPAFADPHNPAAIGGSINFGVGKNFPEFENHPLEHAPDYASGLLVSNDRETWSLQDWKAVAKQYGLAVGGSKQDVINRVESHEATFADEGGE